MAQVILPKTGLRTYEAGDAPSLWGPGLKAGAEEFESRIGLTYEGNPDGQLKGDWYGQTCWDSEGGVMYECTSPGAAGTAVWTLRSALPTGAVIGGLWQDLPNGFLPFDGVVRIEADYPALFAVLPSTFKVGANFTLPLIGNTDWILLGGGGAGNIGAIVGSDETDDFTMTEAMMGSTLDATPVREADADYSSDTRRLVRVVPETDTSPFENPDEFNIPFSPRRLKLLIGIKF